MVIEIKILNFPSDHDKNSLNMMKATIKIIDFGFATRLNGPLTYTALGTPLNMDPQILEHIKTGIPNAGYNEQVDIWSLGTLCYEMVVGHSAFSGASMDELFQKVKIGKYSLPMTLSKEVVSFINFSAFIYEIKQYYTINHEIIAYKEHKNKLGGLLFSEKKHKKRTVFRKNDTE